MPRLTLSEALERGRRAKLHSQIGALERELDNLLSYTDSSSRRRYYRLLMKSNRLKQQLDQSQFAIE